MKKTKLEKKVDKEEIWKDIPGFEGYYQINRIGQVRSLDRYMRAGIKYNNKILKKGRILIPQINNKGYYYYALSIENKRYNKFLHRLLAETFISNPDNYPVINHIDGNPKNNSLQNLEWCTRSHNSKEAFRLGLNKSQKYWLNKKNGEHPRSKRVNQYDLNNNYIKTYDSISEASRELNIHVCNIYDCCNFIKNTAGGYIWKYADEKPKYTKSEMKKALSIVRFINRDLKRTTKKSFERECKKHLVGETR